MAKSSWATYQQAIKVLDKFRNDFGVATTLPLQPVTMALFISYLFSKGYASSTVATYTSAVSFVHKINGFKDPADNFLVEKALQGTKKLKPQVDTRLPITYPILLKLVQASNHCFNTKFQQCMCTSMFLLAFAAFLRVGEFTVSHNNWENVLRLENLEWAKSGNLKLRFTNFKHSKGREALIEINKQPGNNCPVKALQQYIALRGYESGCLYQWPSGNPVTRAEFVRMLNDCLKFSNLDPSVYKSHSLRIGAACQAAANGYSDAQVREMGRWKSDAFKRYIRL